MEQRKINNPTTFFPKETFHDGKSGISPTYFKMEGAENYS